MGTQVASHRFFLGLYFFHPSSDYLAVASMPCGLSIFYAAKCSYTSFIHGGQ